MSGPTPLQSKRHHITFVLCGDPKTGKTCLTHRYMYRIFSDAECDPTDDDPTGPRENWLNVSHMRQDYRIKLDISPSLPLTFIEDPGRWKGADVLFLIYAVNNQQSFDDLVALQGTNFSQNFNAAEKLVKVVVATHVDLAEGTWKVSEQQGRHLAQQLGCTFMATSAWNGAGVAELFDFYIKKGIEKQQEEYRLLCSNVSGQNDPPGENGKAKGRLPEFVARMTRVFRTKSKDNHSSREISR